MCIGDMITEARVRRRKELRAQLLALMQGREPESGEQHAAWADRVRKVQAELKVLEQS